MATAAATSTRLGRSSQQQSPMGDIPTELPTVNPENPERQDRPPDQRTQGQLFSATNDSNYNIPSLSREIEEFKKFNHEEAYWRNTEEFYPNPLYTLQSEENQLEARIYKANLTQANMLWRRGNKPPRMYPSVDEWSKLPDNLIDALDKAMTLDYVQGMEKGEFTTRFFPNEIRHERFLRELNEFTKRHKYIATAPRPQWNHSSHLVRSGMD